MFKGYCLVGDLKSAVDHQVDQTSEGVPFEQQRKRRSSEYFAAEVRFELIHYYVLRVGFVLIEQV